VSSVRVFSLCDQGLWLEKGCRGDRMNVQRLLMGSLMAGAIETPPDPTPLSTYGATHTKKYIKEKVS
jgi:hypothetical protein